VEWQGACYVWSLPYWLLNLMAITGSANYNCCLSLVDGFMGQCEIVERHNHCIGASADELIKVPQEMTGEFRKLSSSLEKVGRAFELGLVDA